MNEVKEGWLIKQGGQIKTWKRRYFILKGGTLSYHKKNGDSPKGVIPLIGSKIEECNTEFPNSFCIIPPSGKRTYYIHASSGQERTEWINALKHHQKNEDHTSPKETDWVKKYDHGGKIVYINKRTGVTTYTDPFPQKLSNSGFIQEPNDKDQHSGLPNDKDQYGGFPNDKDQYGGFPNNSKEQYGGFPVDRDQYGGFPNNSKEQYGGLLVSKIKKDSAPSLTKSENGMKSLKESGGLNSPEKRSQERMSSFQPKSDYAALQALDSYSGLPPINDYLGLKPIDAYSGLKPDEYLGLLPDTESKLQLAPGRYYIAKDEYSSLPVTKISKIKPSQSEDYGSLPPTMEK